MTETENGMLGLPSFRRKVRINNRSKKPKKKK